ncbi:MAG: DNA translocase FtsK [Ruminococcus sp.]|nr:DNA translocase FtsK [Ruminococcus sp.]
MAEPKKNSAGTASQQKKNGAAKPQSAPKEKPETKKSEARQAMENEQNQFWSVVLFAVGILITFIVFIKGTAGWRKMHNMLLGLFGVGVIFLPITLIYTAVLIGMEKSQKKVSGRAFWGIAMAFLVSAALQIFVVGELPGRNFWNHFKVLYENGTDLKGGGVASMLIAGPLLGLFGGMGAKIVTIIMFFVFGMLLTGKGLMDFFMLLLKPFKFIGDCFEGLINMLMGGNFEDAFEDDDIDDDKEKNQFDADLEAIRIIDSKYGTQRNSDDLSIRNTTADDDFIFDVPLPADNERKTGASDENSTADEVDENLEKLISRAAGGNAVSEEAGDDASESKKEKAPKEQIYILPSVDLLTPPSVKSNSAEAVIELREKSDIIKNTLKSFGIEVKIMDILRGPSITRYEIQPGAGVKVSKIRGLEDDIALSLAAMGVRIEAPVPGKPVVGIEVPNTNKDMVTLREILQSNEFRSSESKLTFAVGKDIAGNIILGDITKMPHVIIAGTTGSGKSVCTRSIIMSILYNAKPDEVKLILIDPKMVEFKVFDGIPHLLIPIVIDAKKAAGALNWAVNEMMRRYTIFSEIGANDLKSYNYIAEQDELEKMPQIVVFIDELADMMLVAGKEVEDSICRLAQMGRAAGMHLVVATQRPTTDVITGLIKANIPSRIALSVMSQVDSRTIIDTAGADKLLGNGDMLYMPIGMNKPIRVQGCFASNKDITETISFICSQSKAEYDASITEAVENYVPQTKGDKDSYESGSVVTDGDYVERAIEIAVNTGQVSTTMLQKKLKLGYARASRIVDELEEMGVIGPSEGSKPRKVYMSKMQFDERRIRMQEQ